MELKNINDWVITKAYKSVTGVADDSPLGGETMQYQVLLDPTRLAGAGLTVPEVQQALANNNGNAGRRVLLRRRPVLLRPRPRARRDAR